MNDPVLQRVLPYSPWSDPVLSRLPGTQPADVDDWVRIDNAYVGQMALRDWLLDQRRDDVIGALPEAEPALQELLGVSLNLADRLDRFHLSGDEVHRPDGVIVPLRRDDPLWVLGRMFQEDLCILEKRRDEAEHRLTAAVLCFPAAWMLSEKLGRPMFRVHQPVPEYDENIGRRVQRLLDGLRCGHPIWRANAHVHASPELFTPKREAEPEHWSPSGEFIRSERRVLFRLPVTGAIVFSIHTYMVRRNALTPDQRASLIASGRADPD